MGDFIKGFTAGANIEAQRQELMLRRKAQEAQAALQERQWAQEAQMLRERSDALAAAQEDRARMMRDAATAQQWFQEKKTANGGDDRKALLDVIPPVALMNPKLGEALSTVARNVETAGGAMAFQPRIGTAKGQDGKEYQFFQGSPNSAKLIEPGGELGSQMTPLTANGKVVGFQTPKGHFVSLQSAGQADTGKSAELSHLYRSLEVIDKKLDEMPEVEVRKHAWVLGGGDIAADVTAKKARDAVVKRREELLDQINELRGRKKEEKPGASETPKGPARLRFNPGTGTLEPME